MQVSGPLCSKCTKYLLGLAIGLTTIATVTGITGCRQASDATPRPRRPPTTYRLHDFPPLADLLRPSQGPGDRDFAHTLANTLKTRIDETPVTRQ